VLLDMAADEALWDPRTQLHLSARLLSKGVPNMRASPTHKPARVQRAATGMQNRGQERPVSEQQSELNTGKPREVETRHRQ
jgi:hypothetical protein